MAKHVVTLLGEVHAIRQVIFGMLTCHYIEVVQWNALPGNAVRRQPVPLSHPCETRMIPLVPHEQVCRASPDETCLRCGVSKECNQLAKGAHIFGLTIAAAMQTVVEVNDSIPAFFE